MKTSEIPKEELKRGCWYKGEGRFIGALGLWNGTEFYGFQNKHGGYYETCAMYGERGFSPIEELK